MTSTSNKEIFPVLPLRDVVIMPDMVVPLFVGRSKSIMAIEKANAQEQPIVLLTQINSADDVTTDNLYNIGTLANIVQMFRLPDGTLKLIIEGEKRIKVISSFEEDGYISAEVVYHPMIDGGTDETVKSLTKTMKRKFDSYLELIDNSKQEVNEIKEIEDPNKVSDYISTVLNIKITQRQELLEASTLLEKLEKLIVLIEEQIEFLRIDREIKNRVKVQMDKNHKDYYLNEQIKAIQKELNEGDESADELKQLAEKIESKKLSKEAKEKAESELRRLRTMNQMSAEATVARTYLDWLLSLPWGEYTKTKIDINKAKFVLDQDHYGMEKVKDRILDFLAVQQRNKSLSGPILTLVGPPGVGKTSLAKSIAKAIGRKFVRMSLGGVRDEAEIRGHRRTYIGSMPGKIIQNLKKSKTSNPIFLLDEIDKLGQDHRGDPSSALLEVLDPEQNKSFIDHYLEVEFDLSKVMFIATANSYNIPSPLLDRMEIIDISGYTELEKFEITKRHLINRQFNANGAKDGEFKISDSAIRNLIRYYTRESGVRNLEREIGGIIRKGVRKSLEKSSEGKKLKEIVINDTNLKDYAGIPKYRNDDKENAPHVGVTTGLAWTQAGGDILFIEAVVFEGSGKITFTGKLGEVMKESIQAAHIWVKANAKELGIDYEYILKHDIHIHIPEGATPKDGPSAGVAMVTSIVSALLNVPVRNDVGMTGEVTLRGRVLPIGGLKEKILAGVRSGLTTIVIPKDNERNIEDIPQEVLSKIRILPVSDVREVLNFSLCKDRVLADDKSEVQKLERKIRKNKNGVEKLNKISH